jgi:glycosyltransferase involved in cell wall biosynthesis
MRLFQNSAIYPSYRPRLAKLREGATSFDAATKLFLEDRFGASHFLKPVLNHDPDAFFANGDDEATQHMWAAEQGMPQAAGLEDILLAQIEHHRTEVFYNLDPMRYGNSFLARLPGCVRRTIAWRAAPSQGGQFLAHDVIVNNFPSILEGYRSQGARAEYLAPAHDWEMDAYAARTERPIDVLFIGTFSRHHRARAAMLENIAAMANRLSVVMHLDTSRYTKLAETPLGWFGPLRKDRRSRMIRMVSHPPVFGRELLNALSNAKIVVNGAIDMAGPDRGNMRVWEALGCGATLISDRGRYPDGIVDGIHFAGYDDAGQVPDLIDQLIANPARREAMASAGNAAISTNYDKSLQWRRFSELVD